MASNKLYFPIEQIDRAIELRMRKAVIAAGHWPDNALYLDQPPQAWEAAKKAIEDSGKPLIEVFGVGNFTDRGQLKRNNILIHNLNVNTGDIGLGAHKYFRKNVNGSFTQFQAPETTDDLEYEIRFVVYDTQLDRVIKTLMQAAFGNRQWVRGVDENMQDLENGFWMFKSGNPVDLSGNKFIERLQRFVVKDVVIVPDTIVREVVPAAVEIGFGTGTDITQNKPGDAVEVDFTIQDEETE